MSWDIIPSNTFSRFSPSPSSRFRSPSDEKSSSKVFSLDGGLLEPDCFKEESVGGPKIRNGGER